MDKLTDNEKARLKIFEEYTDLNEIYILQSRISKLTKTIKRSLKEYKEEKNFNADITVIDNSTNNAIDRFKRIIEIRGAHVHVKRYTTKDINDFLFKKEYIKKVKNYQSSI